MTTQSETIVWHKYPKSKPPKKYTLCYYMVSALEGGTFTTSALWRFGYKGWGFYYEEICTEPLDDVIAWAEMPVGWKEEK